MADRRRGPVARHVLAAVALVAAVAGCAGVPTGGAVHVGRSLPPIGGLGDVDVRVLPPSWHPGLAPADVVGGFLRALVNDDDNYGIARTYLTAAGSQSWQVDDGVTTYDDAGLDVSAPATGAGTRVVSVSAPRIGEVDRRGGYLPRPGVLHASFTLVRVGHDDWQINRLPNGVLLSALDAQRSFRVADVYYLNATGHTLVPEEVLLQNTQRGVATALVRALLAGPGAWLAPAVRSAAPAGTTLVGNVPVDAGGTADVNLSAAARSASPADLAALSAQIVWSLRQVPEVTAVRLFSDGTPLPVPGAAQRQPVFSWSTFDPAAPSSTPDLLYVVDGRLVTTGRDQAALSRSDPAQVVSVGRSRDGTTLAVVRAAPDGEQLLTGRIGSRLAPRLSAAAFTAPSFDAFGDALSVAATNGGQRVVATGPDGRVRPVVADLPRAPVTALRVSRDGARVAVVAGGQLLVGRLVSGRPLAIGGLHPVAPQLADVRGVAWSGPDDVVVTAAGGPQRQVVETDSAGYSPRTVAVTANRSPSVDVAAAPGLPLVVLTRAGDVLRDSGGWIRLAQAAAIVYSD